MALERRKTAVANGSVQIDLGLGRYVIQITSADWDGSQEATLEVSASGDDGEWSPAYEDDRTTAIVRTAEGKLYEMQGGVFVRITVANYAGPVHLLASRFM